MGFGERRIHRVELGLVGRSEVERRGHASDQHRDLARFAEDAVEVLAGLGGRQTAQHVIRAKGQDHRVDLWPEDPADPGKTAGRGVAGDTGIHHRHIMAAGNQPAFELRHKARILRQAEARRQAVTEGQNRDLLCCGRA